LGGLAGVYSRFYELSRFCVIALVCCGPLFAQKIALIVPEKSIQTEQYASQLSETLSSKLYIQDSEMSLAAFRSVKLENPFNLTASESRDIGSVLGCDYFLLIKSATLRRTSFERDEFYESFASVFLVSARSGRLVRWDLKSFEADTPAESERALLKSGNKFAAEIYGHLESFQKAKPNAVRTDAIEEVPTDSLETKNFRPPLPYKRIKPEYPRTAYFYDIRATIEAAVDIDQNGAVTGIAIERWAGFGLDEAVAEAVRKMNWRPATRNGKTLPMRVLLRYNFTKIEKE